MSTKVSAIISAYYAEKFLESRIRNLVAQTLLPEIIVVCKMGSVEEEIASQFAGVLKILRTDNVPTVYQAWNIGIAHSEGEFITNANTDDKAHEEAFEKAATILSTKPRYAGVYYDLAIVEEPDGVPVNFFEWAEGGLPQLLKGCFLGPMPVWRRSLHEKYGMFREDMCVAGDYEFWLRCVSKGEQFFHLREVLGTYLKRKDSREMREPVRTAWETSRARAMYRQAVSNGT